MTAWHTADGTRIWRLPGIAANREETGQAAACATDDTLARIAAEGFTGVWHFCQLPDLMRSTVFPELNLDHADACVASLQAAVDRARAHGLDTWLYFNEPGGVPQNHPFWETHRHLQGSSKWNLHALCTSTPEVQAYFRQAVESVFERLHGVAGVILITACENLTHCWSKINRRTRGEPPPACPRCAPREPADIILELLDTWSDLSRRFGFRVLAWNWEWAYYYPDPQAEIVSRLPAGMELLLDMEIGGSKLVAGRTVPVGEYALSYAGPSPRLVGSRAIAGDRPVHAKLQVNNTHEFCTVPNLPVLATLHTKLAAMTELGLDGYMGCWNIGLDSTLNTFAVEYFRTDVQSFLNQQKFLKVVGEAFFGAVDTELLIEAWRGFSEAFEAYPFSIPLLYFGPHNDAPARPLLLDFAGQPIGRSYMPDEPGDDLSRCLSELSIDEVVTACTTMAERWEEALVPYERALAGHPSQELGVARMTAIQLRSLLNVYRFHGVRARVLAEQGLAPPCRLPRDPELLAIMAEEAANVRRALPLVEADSRLGFHECYQGYKYDAGTIRAKLAAMEAELQAPT